MSEMAAIPPAIIETSFLMCFFMCCCFVVVCFSVSASPRKPKKELQKDYNHSQWHQQGQDKDQNGQNPDPIPSGLTKAIQLSRSIGVALIFAVADILGLRRRPVRPIIRQACFGMRLRPRAILSPGGFSALIVARVVPDTVGYRALSVSDRAVVMCEPCASGSASSVAFPIILIMSGGHERYGSNSPRHNCDQLFNVLFHVSVLLFCCFLFFSVCQPRKAKGGINRETIITRKVLVVK